MTACSEASRDAGEQMIGTAPEARTWLVVEQPGPWGRRALTDSHLDPVLGEALDVASATHQARVALARRTGRHADHHDAAARRVWIASTRPGASWLLTGRIDDVAALGQLAWGALDQGDLHAVSASMPELQLTTDPLLLVCTNGRRDLCCAAAGRPLAGQLRDKFGDLVWETTHLSGHRFAPTAVVLPTGYVYGRLTPDQAVAAFESAARSAVSLAGCRGRSTFTPPGQAAEAAVRELTDESGADLVDVVAVSGPSPDWSVEVGHADGRRWSVTVRESTGRQRPESCGKPATAVISYVADPPHPVPAGSARLLP